MEDQHHQQDLVRVTDYGLPQVSAKQTLTPLDMNMPRLYGMRWILCFPLDSKASKLNVYEDLRAGLAHTITKIPWIAGKLVQQEGSSTNESKIQVVDGDLGVRLKFNDLATTNFPSYEQLNAAHFPLSKLPTAQLSPLNVMPQGTDIPVMAAQANFIDGGLLLTIGAHHSVCDAFGLCTVLETWAQMTTAIAKDTSLIEPDSLINDRAPLMTGTQGAHLDDFPEYVLAPTQPAAVTDVNTHQMAVTPFKMPAMSAHIFRFSPTSLKSLKIAAAAYSTSDALNALIWRHVTFARMNASSQEPNTVNGNGSTALLYSANIRSRLSPPLPSNYTGNASVAGITRHMSFVEMAAPGGLVITAAAIRSSIKTLARPNRVAMTIGLIDSRPNPTDYKFAYNGFLGPDLSTTSWADLNVFEMEWGSVGKAEIVRVPGEGADGSMVVLPRCEDGALEVVLALESRAMEVLMGDEDFRKYAEAWA